MSKRSCYLNAKEEEAHTNFLIAASQYVNNISSRVVKAHINILSSETVRMRNYPMDGRDKEKEYCQYCLSPWKNGNFSLKILPASKRGKKMKKLLNKIKKKKMLGKIERKVIEAGNFKNTMRLKCLICTKEFKLKVRNKKEAGITLEEQRDPVPVLPFMKTRKKKMKQNNFHGLNPMFVEKCRGSGSGVTTEKIQSSDVGSYCGQNGDPDEIELTYQSHPSAKIRKVEVLDLDPEVPPKKNKKKWKKKKKARAENTAPITPVGVLNEPSSTPYNAPGDTSYNSPCATAYTTPYEAGCVIPYNMRYNTPYGIPYNNQTFATLYDESYNNAFYNTSYDGVHANTDNYSAVGFDPADTVSDTSKKKKKKKRKKKGASKYKNVSNKTSMTNLLVNPFSGMVQEICSLPKKKKKLSQWKKLIGEEEKKTVSSHSLKDFLTKL